MPTAVSAEPGALPASLIAIAVGTLIVVAQGWLAEATKRSYGSRMRPGEWYDRFAVVAFALFGACVHLAGLAGVAVTLAT